MTQNALPNSSEDILGMLTASFVDTVVLVPGLFFMTACFLKTWALQVTILVYRHVHFLRKLHISGGLNCSVDQWKVYIVLALWPVDSSEFPPIFWSVQYNFRFLIRHGNKSSKGGLKVNGLYILKELSGSTVCFYSLSSLLISGQSSEETQPSSARCTHFNRNNALRIPILTPPPPHPVADHWQHRVIIVQWWTLNLNLNLNQSFSCQGSSFRSLALKLAPGFQSSKFHLEWDTALMTDCCLKSES